MAVNLPMSVYFVCSELELWNPSNGVAALFFSQVTALETLVGCPSGLSPANSDEVDVDPIPLRAFLQAAHGLETMPWSDHFGRRLAEIRGLYHRPLGPRGALAAPDGGADTR